MMVSDEVFQSTIQYQGLTINISAFRLLYLYLLLCQSEQVSFEDLNTHFLNHPLIQRHFSTDTLYNYIQTLRMFGCSITRSEEQGHLTYRMPDHPLKITSTAAEIQTLQSICQLLSQRPLTGLYKSFYLLCKRITKIPSDHSAFNLGALIEPDLPESLLQQIDQFQKYCREKQVLEITLEEPKGPPLRKLIEPIEVVYTKRKLILVGNDPKTLKKCRYDIGRIVSHRQLPNQVRFQTLKTTVTFKLTGRLALNYRPYPEEVVLNKGDFLLIKHQTEEVGALLKRLMKYGDKCQVISPLSARKEMHHMVETLLLTLREPILYDVDSLVSKAQTDGNLHK